MPKELKDRFRRVLRQRRATVYASAAVAAVAVATVSAGLMALPSAAGAAGRSSVPVPVAAARRDAAPALRMMAQHVGDPHPAGLPIRAAAATRLRASMLRMARLSGDAHPAWIMAVDTTRAWGLQDATPGDYVPGSASEPAYLVVLKGKFKLTLASVPPGAPLPTGDYLAVTVNPSTLQILDLGLSNQAPPVALRRYGPVSNLTR
jgi:hypothetical protein